MESPLFKGLGCFLIMILLLMRVYIVLLTPQAEYVYYGVIPERIYQYTLGEWYTSGIWLLEPASLYDYGYISILASQDGTQVRVYTLPDRQLVSEATLDSMQKHYVRLPNGTMFKIVSSKLVSVLLFSPPARGGIPGVNVTESPGINGFYPTVEGAYVGREFIIEASQGLLGFNYYIFALEEAEVTLTADDGSTRSYKLEANGYENIQLKPLTTYRVTSTGNIMIKGGGMGGWSDRSFFIPSAEGGFIGRRFYTVTWRTFDEKEEEFFYISALEDTKVTIWDLPNRKILLELDVKAGEPAKIKPTVYAGTKAPAIAVDSEKPIVLQFLHSGNTIRSYGYSYGPGFTYMGIRPNEDTPFFLPTNSTIYAYLFTSEDANIVVDDVPMTLRTDVPWVISTPGPHTVRSNKNLVLLLLHYPLIPPNQGINGFGVPVPCVQTVSVTPSVTLHPISGEGFTLPFNYIIILVVLLVIVIVIVFLRRRKNRRK
ncbi:MAG: hypothetical protein QW304_07980 [Thermoproteota archaeon]